MSALLQSPQLASMKVQTLREPSSLSPKVSVPVPVSVRNEFAENALSLLREFLASIDNNAAAGDFQSAALSLSCLGEPPHQNEIPSSHTSLPPEASPINLVVYKLRSARVARQQRREQRLPGTTPISPPIPIPKHTYIPEVYQVTPKKPRDLRQEAILRVWDQARLRRWWAWHDRQMELLKEDKLQKQRRRQFLSNLRTHPWMHEEARQNVEQIQRRQQRAQLLSKLRTSPTELTSLSKQPVVSPRTEQEIVEALSQRRDSLKKLRARTPTSPKSARFSPITGYSATSRTADDHRTTLVGAHSGDLKERRLQDFWEKWAAKETLFEQRNAIRNEMDTVLARPNLVPSPNKQILRLAAKRWWIKEENAY
ncbi:hypothetical protein SpCBS45565_g04931 [Spizellomyces sp. 'palustris']|nr:hypothetical protein SpCBS45565_g04931 [Spizellomyces sp. 'palustris']